LVAISDSVAETLDVPARGVIGLISSSENLKRELLSSFVSNYVFNISSSLKVQEIIQKLRRSITGGNFTQLLKIKSRLPVSNVTYVMISEINIASSPSAAPSGLQVLVQGVSGIYM
jgi:hypothetical protein